MKTIDQLSLNAFSVEELAMNELIEIEGGKVFWDTAFGKICLAFLVGFAGALGASLVD